MYSCCGISAVKAVAFRSSNELVWEDHAWSAEFGIQLICCWMHRSRFVQVISRNVSCQISKSSPINALEQSRIAS